MMNDGGKRMTYESGALREPSTGKGAYELISPFALERIAKWYELGSQKYAERNWEKGIPFGRLIQSTFRHLVRWMIGNREEDHLAAVCWNVMAMIHFEETGQARDLNNYPRYKRVTPKIQPATAPKPAMKRGYEIIAVDFDGCLCTDAWPGIGDANSHLIADMLCAKAKGAKVILWTCREGAQLREAVEWCRDWGLEFDAVNENLPEMTAHYGNDSRKIGADVYIDDKAVREIAWKGMRDDE